MYVFITYIYFILYTEYLGLCCVYVAEMCRNPPLELMETGLSGHGSRLGRVPLKEGVEKIFASFEMRPALSRWMDGELFVQ